MTEKNLQHRIWNIGFERISVQIKKYEELGKDVVLCCYEDVRQPDEWCHRLVFAEWWFKQTGEVILELPNPQPVKIKSKVIVKPKLEEQSKKNPQFMRLKNF